jgi:hypothetical protein
LRTFNENIIHTKQLLYGILFTLACSFIILSRNINALFSWNILSFVISCSFLMWFNGLCLPQITLMTQRECSKLHYFADKRQLPHSADYAVPVYVTKLWGEHARSFLVTSLVLPLHVNGLFSRRSRWWRRGNAASCIISQTKDSYLIVETMQFMFIQQSCEGTCSFIPCSSLTCERPILPQIPLITQRECSKLHYFAEKRQLPHSRVMQFMFMQQSCERIPSFFPCSLLTCERPILPQITLMTQRECSKLHYFADKRQLPHSGDNAVHVYATKLWGEHAH